MKKIFTKYKQIILAIICLGLVLVTALSVIHQKQRNKFNELYYSNMFEGMGECENISLHDKKSVKFCETIESIKSKKKVILDDVLIFNKLRETVKDELSEVEYHVSFSNDTPLYLQKKKAALVYERLNRKENWFRIASFDSCIDLGAYHSTYQHSASGLKKCLEEIDNEVDGLNARIRGLTDAFEKYKKLDQSYQGELEAEIKKHWEL